MLFLAVVAAGLVGLAAAPQARVERAVPFAVGETLTYDVSWSSYLTAGTAVAAVKDKQPSANSTAYSIIVEGRPTPLVQKLYTLYYRAETLLDVYTLLPERGDVYSEEGSRKRTRTTTFDRHAQPLAQDALSAIYVLRAAALKPGGRITMPVVDNGIVYTVRVDVGDPEPIQAPIGTTSAWKMKLTATNERGEPAGHNMAIWISTDRRRLPVKLQADLPVGNFSLLLREAR